jgi:hypothetical protein
MAVRKKVATFQQVRGLARLLLKEDERRTDVRGEGPQQSERA